MCRMLAVRAPDAHVRRRILSTFRSQARRGYTGPPKTHRTHTHGWGIAGVGLEGPELLGRSALDATGDPRYDMAVGLSKDVDPAAFVLAHLRNASVGHVVPVNNQPFVRDGWAFAHNGTIYGLEPPPGARPEGFTDSEAFFLHLLDEWRRRGSMWDAIHDVVPRIAASHRHSSLTFLVTSGDELFAFRSVGPDHKYCESLQAAADHYSLGWGPLPGGALVVTQEPQLFAPWPAWSPIPDGHLLHVAAEGVPRLSPVLATHAQTLRPVGQVLA